MQENEKVANIAVMRHSGSDGSCSVEYKTTDGSALKGKDYSAIVGNLTFKEGEVGKTIEI